MTCSTATSCITLHSVIGLFIDNMTIDLNLNWERIILWHKFITYQHENHTMHSLEKMLFKYSIPNEWGDFGQMCLHFSCSLFFT